MVLVDTSVWIRHLSNRAPYTAQLQRLLDSSEVLGHELIYGELLIGNRGGRRKVLQEYAYLPAAAIIHHTELVEFVLGHALMGRGIGWIDAHLLASTMLSQGRLWSADQPLIEVARELGVNYEFR